MSTDYKCSVCEEDVVSKNAHADNPWLCIKALKNTILIHRTLYANVRLIAERLEEAKDRSMDAAFGVRVLKDALKKVDNKDTSPLYAFYRRAG